MYFIMHVCVLIQYTYTVFFSFLLLWQVSHKADRNVVPFSNFGKGYSLNRVSFWEQYNRDDDDAVTPLFVLFNLFLHCDGQVVYADLSLPSYIDSYIDVYS